MASPVHADWESDVTATILTEFDDNITYAEDDPENDVNTTLLVGLGLDREEKTFTFSGILNIINQNFFQSPEYNNNAQEFIVNYQKDFTRYDRFRLWNRLTHAEAPLSYQDDFGRSSGRYEYLRQKFGLGYEKDLSRQFALRVNYSNELYTTARDDLSDSFLNQFNLDLSYLPTSDSRFLIGYNMVTRTYDPGDRLFVHDLTVGYQRTLTIHLSLVARAGVSFIDNADDQMIRQNTSFSLINEVDPKTQWRLEVKQDTYPSSSSAVTFDAWRFNAVFKRQLSQRMNFNASSFYSQGEYDGIDIDEDFFGVRVYFDYDIRPDFKTYIAYVFSEKMSSDAAREYQKNLITLGFTYAF